MIVSTSEAPRYLTRFSDGSHEAASDTTEDKGGRNSGFRPHDLLEAALATCVNMTVRMFAESRAMPLRSVKTKVTLDRRMPDEVVFQYQVELEGDLSTGQKQELLRAAAACPVRRTLSKQIRFESSSELQDVRINP
jgi:putative redox protein